MKIVVYDDLVSVYETANDGVGNEACPAGDKVSFHFFSAYSAGS